MGGTSNLVVTGLGTATTGVGGFTEAATHTGADVTTTITTAGALVNTSTLAGPLGTVTFTDANTGVGAAATTLATGTLTGRVINVTVTGATGDFILTGTNPATITATAGVHGLTGGAGADTITGFTGADTITGGIGADIMDAGSAVAGVVDNFPIAATTDTGVVLGYVGNAATMATTGFAINTSGLDKISNFAVGDTITTGVTYAAGAAATAMLRNGGTSVTQAATDAGTQNALLVGSYTADTNQFVVSPAGSDSLFVYDDNGTTAAGGYRGIVLVGYVDLEGNDATGLTGVFTAS